MKHLLNILIGKTCPKGNFPMFTVCIHVDLDDLGHFNANAICLLKIRSYTHVCSTTKRWRVHQTAVDYFVILGVRPLFFLRILQDITIMHRPFLSFHALENSPAFFGLRSFLIAIELHGIEHLCFRLEALCVPDTNSKFELTVQGNLFSTALYSGTWNVAKIKHWTVSRNCRTFWTQKACQPLVCWLMVCFSYYRLNNRMKCCCIFRIV